MPRRPASAGRAGSGVFLCAGQVFSISSSSGTPSIAGQPKTFLVNQLVFFREELRASPVMQPVARGMSDRDGFTLVISDPTKFGEGDMRAMMPRFTGEALAANLKLLARFQALAAEAGCTPAQLCLAWLMAKDPIIVSIPVVLVFLYLQKYLVSGLTAGPEEWSRSIAATSAGRLAW